MAKERLDVLLVERNLAESRERAKITIMEGLVLVNGQKVLIPFIYKSTDNMMIQLLKQAGAGYSDADGNVFRYTVAWEETVFPSDRQQMVTGDAWHLTLFTCTYNGEKRFTLRCVLADQEK